ncbi:hypothetical protein RJ639_043573 [Escallonia herrerae]|uniref:Uncharacterized protein n=1 Tax=Escallonia herrerae TaxID=1293975 RepID=A0AA88WCF2_9ASTE|nr:hypothetical protein RJ639_043573 [Escallonia herrerae]
MHLKKCEIAQVLELAEVRFWRENLQGMEMKPFFFISLLGFFFILLRSSGAVAVTPHPKDSLKSILGEENLGAWKKGILNSAAEAPGQTPASTLVLAQKRTRRPDILSGFRRYRDGWDIANKHYWASVGFTGATGFIVAVLWIGCILLSVGQDEFHGEALNTLNYVVNQSDYTVQTLQNVTEYMSLAKTVNVAHVFLPSDVKDDIDKLNADLNAAADTLRQKTNENSAKIRRVFNAVYSPCNLMIPLIFLDFLCVSIPMFMFIDKYVPCRRSTLITVAAVMLLVSILGLFMSILGHQHAIHIFIISGWLLVAVTFILCGVFVILDNAISDTCVSMGEWVDNPHAESALSNILPCVDQATTNHTLIKSKQVVTDIANIVNGFIDTFANSNPPPQANSNFFNQSGPLVPHLCYPYDFQLQDRQCSPQEVSLANASLVWQNYTCTAAASGYCSDVGRLTPDMYGQLVGAVNISYALEHYAPPLLSLQDCNFVRDTFRNITSDHCPPLEQHLRTVNAGLALISVGVMLSLALWMLYANRPRREEVFVKLSSLI